jgi:hypothetical protein
MAHTPATESVEERATKRACAGGKVDRGEDVCRQWRVRTRDRAVGTATRACRSGGRRLELWHVAGVARLSGDGRREGRETVGFGLRRMAGVGAAAGKHGCGAGGQSWSCSKELALT